MATSPPQPHQTVQSPHPQTSRSPSPAPPAPLPSSPGPRASALQKLYNDAITHVLKTCSYSNFAACFPTPAEQVPGSVKLLHEQFTQHLGKSMRDEFDAILRERDVVVSLNELDRLVDEARRRRSKAIEEGDGEGTGLVPIPPHTLPAQQLYLSHLAPSLSAHSRELTARQEAVQTENVELLERVMRQRKEIQALVRGVENAVADLDASVAALKPEEIDGLREEVRDVDREMREA